MKLELHALSVSYDGAPVVHGINLSVASGDIVVTIGRNGIGKSSILKGCLGLCETTGIVRVNDRVVSGPPDRRVREFGLALLPQDLRVFGSLTGRQNLLLAASRKPEAFRTVLEDWLSGRSESSAPWSSLNDLLDIVRLKLDVPAAGLSGGEQSIIGLIGTVLVCESFLLLDEITAGMSPVAVPAIRTALTSMAATRQFGMILAEQDHVFGLAVATRLLWVEDPASTDVATVFEVPGELLRDAKQQAPPPVDLISWLTDTPWGHSVLDGSASK